MKLITPEEAAVLPKKIQNRSHPVRNMLLHLQVGQILKVDKADWNWKRKGPAALCRDVESKSKLKFTCYILLDKSAWVITRTA